MGEGGREGERTNGLCDGRSGTWILPKESAEEGAYSSGKLTAI